MKNILLFFFLFCPLFIFANQTYEPKLADYFIEGDQVNFKLDNGWVFTASTPNQNMIYVLDRLMGMRARIQTYPESPFLNISFENPTHLGSDKVSFFGYVTEETYKLSATISNIEADRCFCFPQTRVTLSDGSCWMVKCRHCTYLIETHWSLGDRIILSKDYLSKNKYSLVNLDVSTDPKHEKDPRTVEATPLEQ